jgi:hypothetical protein
VGKAGGQRCIKRSGMSLRDHPQHFPSPQTFKDHEP